MRSFVVSWRAMALSDEDLFGQFQAGDASSFDALLTRYQASVFRVVLGYMKDHASAQDVFQDVFFKIIRKKDQFKAATSFKAWMYTICRTTCVDALRARSRKKEDVPIDSAASFLAPEAPDSLTSRDLRAWVDELPPEQKEALTLKIWGDWSVDEIAQVTDCPPDTVKSRLRYALKALRVKCEKRKASI